jgi:hypothetical protein
MKEFFIAELCLIDFVRMERVRDSLMPVEIGSMLVENLFAGQFRLVHGVPLEKEHRAAKETLPPVECKEPVLVLLEKVVLETG